jgi:hypothetical protein
MVGFEEFVGDKVDGKAHIFIAVHWSLKVEIFYICTAILGICGGEYAVPQHLAGGHVGGTRGDFAGVFYKVAPDRDAYTIGVLLLWSIVDNDAPVFWYVFDLVGER